MAITYVNAGTHMDVIAGTNTLAYPASIIANDTLIACGYTRVTTDTIAAPSSTLTWTEQIALSTHTKIWTAPYDGSATAPTIVSGGKATYAIMLAIRGADLVSTVDATASLDNGVHSQMHYPGLTIANNNEFVLTFSRNVQTNAGVAPTAGFNEVEDFQPTSGGSNSVYVQYAIQTSKSNLVAADLTTTSGVSTNQFGLSISINAAATGGGQLISGALVNGILLGVLAT